MPPQKIMIIRHAEKPEPDRPATGVAELGAADADSLIVRGWQRAGALVPFFATPWMTGIARPGVVYAANAKTKKGTERSMETVTPLVARLGCEFVTAFSKNDTSAAMADALDREGVVLVAWEHKKLPGLVQALPDPPAAPDKFPSDRFDLVWVLDRTDTGWKFTELGQSLLAGDAPP